MEQRHDLGRTARRRLGTFLALGAAAMLSLSACGSDADSSADPDPSALTGKTYVSDAATNRIVPGGGPLTVSFAAGDRVSVNGGCNGHGGTATFDGESLSVDHLVGTMMACPPPRDKVDGWIATLFRDPLTWRLDGRTLTLSRGDQKVTLNEHVSRAVAGTTWTVTGLVRNEGVESSAVLERVKPTLRIGADGAFSGFAGCNQMHGNAVVSGSGEDQRVEFGPIATTRKICPPEVMDVEQAVLAAVDGATTVTVDGDELRLTNVKDPSTGLRLSATPPTSGE